MDKAEFIKGIAELEMDAYDSLPPEVKAVFDACTRKTSVLKIMNLPGVKTNLKKLGPTVFAEKLEGILAEQAKDEEVFPA